MSWQAVLFSALLRHLRAQGSAEHSARTTLGWAQRYILFCGNRHPSLLGPHEVLAFVTHLERDLHLGRQARRQAFASLRCVQGWVTTSKAEGAAPGAFSRRS